MSGVMLEHQAVAHAWLTDSEVGALAALGGGMTLAAAGRELGVSERTVRRRVQTACERIGVCTTIEAIAWAARRDLI